MFFSQALPLSLCIWLSKASAPFLTHGRTTSGRTSTSSVACRSFLGRGLLLPPESPSDSRVFSEPSAYRSVSDYVGGLHGGKYTFDTTIYGVTSVNYDKSVMFGNVIEESSQASIVADIPIDMAQQKPKWSSRRIPLSASTTLPIVSVASDSDSFCESTATIVNEELSWEPFFATIEHAEPIGRPRRVRMAYKNRLN
jgi:hypothetical protein